MKYKISEMFYSLQGEGYWAGTPMFFVRLSQCPVGKTKGFCTTFDGKEFTCDTGESYLRRRSDVPFTPYTKVNVELSAAMIWAEVAKYPTDTLCLTGGEPLAQDVDEIITAKPHNKRIHIETSGTIYYSPPPFATAWITLSPKKGCLKGMKTNACEVKLLVDADTDFDKDIHPWVDKKLLFLQPIEAANPERTQENLSHTIHLCLEHNLRLSLQTHKHLGLR